MKTWKQKWNDANPCNKCQSREVGCHGKCERYQKWSVAKQEEWEKIRDIKREEREEDDRKHDRVRRMQKARRSRSYK